MYVMQHKLEFPLAVQRTFCSTNNVWRKYNAYGNTSLRTSFT